MFRNHLKIAWRNLIKNKASSFINVGGLAVGMAVAMLIGLWIWDELSFDKYHQNYDRIALVMQKKTFNGTVATMEAEQGALIFVLFSSLQGFKREMLLEKDFDSIEQGVAMLTYLIINGFKS